MFSDATNRDLGWKRPLFLLKRSYILPLPHENPISETRRERPFAERREKYEEICWAKTNSELEKGFFPTSVFGVSHFSGDDFGTHFSSCSLPKLELSLQIFPCTVVSHPSSRPTPCQKMGMLHCYLS